VGDGLVAGVLGAVENSGVLLVRKPTISTPTATPPTKVSTAIHQRDRRWGGIVASSAWCFESVPATSRLLGWSG
jgi:hypothetical protein